MLSLLKWKYLAFYKKLEPRLYDSGSFFLLPYQWKLVMMKEPYIGYWYRAITTECVVWIIWPYVGNVVKNIFSDYVFFQAK